MSVLIAQEESYETLILPKNLRVFPAKSGSMVKALNLQANPPEGESCISRACKSSGYPDLGESPLENKAISADPSN